MSQLPKIILKLPNIVTAFRLALSFVFFYLCMQKSNYSVEAVIVFTIAAVTDFIDGSLARKLKIESSFGEKFDPIADKFLTTAAFVAFAIQGIIEFWMVSIVVFRDIFTTVMRQKFFITKNIPTSKSAKFKTVIQFIFISFLLILRMLDSLGSSVHHIIYSPAIFYVMLGITILTVWTMLEYIIQMIKVK